MNSTTTSTIMDHVSRIAPELPTFLAVLIAALIPIYTGSHASLSRPSSAAKTTKKTNKKSSNSRAKSDRKMEGLSPIDALLYPLATGAMLTGLYYLIKWLQDPALLNKILNYYLSVFGVVAIWTLVRDGTRNAIDLVWPEKYSADGKTWAVDIKKRRFFSGAESRTSPFPGILSTLRLSESIRTALWKFREARTKPYATIQVTAKHFGDTSFELDDGAILATLVSVASLIYYNFYSKPWWLTNLFGFSFCYSALQLLSPTTFWTGSLILTSLFFYDIYFVFYTPMMIEVATKLDIPVKLLIPKRANEKTPVGEQALTLLGLGDIVLPGIMLGLALRFDLFMFYLRKQKVHSSVDKKQVKAEYIPATGSWGRRVWLSSAANKDEGYSFPKPYFTAGITGYSIGLLTTECVMVIFRHGQPALLYLVPSVLGSSWMTAWVRGEFKQMWNYTEDQEQEKKDEKKKETASGDGNVNGNEAEVKTVEEIQKTGGRMRRASLVKEGKIQKDPDSKEERRIFAFTIVRAESLNASDEAGDAAILTEEDDTEPSSTARQDQASITNRSRKA